MGDWLSLSESAALLKLDPSSLRWAIKRGKLAARKTSDRVILIERGEVERYARETSRKAVRGP